MGKRKWLFLLILVEVGIVLIMALFWVNNTTLNSDEIEVSMKYYEKKDFQSIIIGKSTFYDVYKVANTQTMQITSYGGVCDYPMLNGGYIRIKFYGKEMVVGNVEEIPPAISMTHPTM